MNRKITKDASILFTYLKESKDSRDICVSVFAAISFTTAKQWKQSRATDKGMARQNMGSRYDAALHIRPEEGMKS